MSPVQPPGQPLEAQVIFTWHCPLQWQQCLWLTLLPLRLWSLLEATMPASPSRPHLLWMCLSSSPPWMGLLVVCIPLTPTITLPPPPLLPIFPPSPDPPSIPFTILLCPSHPYSSLLPLSFSPFPHPPSHPSPSLLTSPPSSWQ